MNDILKAINVFTRSVKITDENITDIYPEPFGEYQEVWPIYGLGNITPIIPDNLNVTLCEISFDDFLVATFAIFANVVKATNESLVDLIKTYNHFNFYPPFDLVEQLDVIPSEIEKSVIETVKEVRLFCLKSTERVLNKCRNKDLINIILGEIIKTNDKTSKMALKDIYLDSNKADPFKED